MERRAVGKSIYDSINFLEKKKRKIKILTNFNNNKSNDKSKRSLERNGRKNFFLPLQLGTWMQIPEITEIIIILIETDYFFFFFFSPTVIHYSWTRDFTNKEGTIEN